MIHIKNYATALDFWLKTDKNYIFQIRYCTLLQVKRLKKILEVKAGYQNKSASSAWRRFVTFNSG